MHLAAALTEGELGGQRVGLDGGQRGPNSGFAAMGGFLQRKAAPPTDRGVHNTPRRAQTIRIISLHSFTSTVYVTFDLFLPAASSTCCVL